jgi:hypothetical protein
MSNDKRNENGTNLPAELPKHPEGSEWFKALGISGVGTSGPIPGEVIYNRVPGWDYVLIDTGIDAEDGRIIADKEADGWLRANDPKVQQGMVKYAHQSGKGVVMTMPSSAHKILLARKEERNRAMHKARMGEFKEAPAQAGSNKKEVNYSATFESERG